MVFIRNPEHAVFDRAILDARGDPAHPVQHSVMTASSFGFFLRG
jgi:hypothetical protein